MFSAALARKLTHFWNVAKLFVAASPLFLAAAAHAATAEQWLHDLDKIAGELQARHPEPFGRTGQTAFMRALDALKADLPALTEEQRMVRAMRIIASVGDGHTQLHPNNSAFSGWYPVRFYEFTDGYFITGAHHTVSELAGAQVLEIAGRPVAQVSRDARALMGADNQYDAMERLYALHNAGLMRGLGYTSTDGALPLKVRLASGKAVSRTLMPMASDSSAIGWVTRPEYWGAVGAPEEWVSAFKGQTAAQLRELNAARPAHLMYRRAFHATPLAGGRTYYIQANIIGGTPNESLPAFFRRALTDVDRLKPDHLIVDLRYNFGGDGSNVWPVVHQFIARKFTPPWKNLYLLTGRKTFSAGVLLAGALVTHMQPSVVGEPAGAALNHYGDANSVDYDATGTRLAVSYARHQLSASNDHSHTIWLDYAAPFSFADYSAGRDPAVDAIVSGKDVRSIGAIAMSDGAVRAYAAYEERRRRFASHDSWRAPSEIDLRTIMRELDDSGRQTAAVEVAALNTRINPLEWRTWMNLGDILMRQGRKVEAIEQYRRSLALKDPTNFNTPRLQRAIEEFEKETAKQPALQR